MSTERRSSRAAISRPGRGAQVRAAERAEAQKRETLLAFDGQEIAFNSGYLISLKVRECPVTDKRPHGLEYSFVLLGPGSGGRRVRLAGVDNAHAVGRERRFDHEHKTRYSTRGDAIGVEEGVAIEVEDVLALAIEFIEKVTMKLRDWGVYG